ncbi:hypothetical protein ACQKIE_13565 [Luteibacter sp. NPDC031894]|uniref:hypothetical protein n=1 Tax=Luteibacter sp. NPDC031894 TaxID=3390572 RepID=UPI003D053F2A
MQHLMGIRRGKVAGAAAVASLIAALCLLIHWILGHDALVSNPDAVDIFLTMAFDSSQAARNHGVSAMLFDPNLLAGYSHWLNANYSPLYPFFFNWMGSDQTTFDTLLRLEFVVRLHMVILALGGYWLSRELGASRWASFFAALILPWMPAVQTTFGWPHILASLAWIPWVLAAQVRMARSDRFDTSATLTLAMSTILLVYAQPAQNLVIAAFASGILWVVPLCRLWRDRQDRTDLRNPSSVILGLAAAVALVLVACGYYLARLVHFQGESIRWLGAFGQIIGAKRVPVDALREFAVSPRDMISAFSFRPEYSSQPGNLFVGISLVAVSTYAVLRAREAFVRSLGIVALVALVLCCRLIVPVTYWIPLINKIRELNWWSCLWVIAVVPLAARGATMLAADARDGAFSRRSAISIAAVIVATAAVVAVVDHSMSRTGAVLTAAMAGAVLLLAASGRSRLYAAAAVAPILAAVTFAPAAYVLPHSDVSNSYFFNPRNLQLRHEARNLANGLPPAQRGLYRAAVDPQVPDFKVLTHMLANEGLRMIRGDIHPQLFSKFELLYFPNVRVQKLFGVRYTVKASKAGDTDLRWEELDGARPRLYFRAVKPTLAKVPAEAVLQESGDEAMRDFVSDKVGIDPRLSGLPESGPGIVTPEILENTATRIRAVVTTASAGILVLNEDPEGSWSAYIDHVIQKGVALNGFQSAFVIPEAGTYEIVIEGGR